MRVGFFKGEEMHNHWDAMTKVRSYWKFPKDWVKESIEPETIYTVVYNYSSWGDDELHGGAENRQYDVLSISVTPEYVIRAQSILDDYKLLKKKEIEYWRSVQTIKEYEAQKQKCDNNESKSSE